MRIQHVEIGHFRKLQAVHIDFSEETTVFVGANNSGKTSAMVALRRFLVERSDFSINDITLTHWAQLNAVGASWEEATANDEADPFDWGSTLPFVDVWLSVPTHELHYVQKLLPSLDWSGESIGVRLRYEPKEISALRHEYLAAKAAAAAVMAVANAPKPPGEPGASESGATAAVGPKAGVEFALWPRSLMDFLSRRLRATFEVRAYLLDPSKLVAPKDGIATPQNLPANSEPIAGDPFKGLIRIDEINAQRGFGAAPQAVSRGGEPADDQAEHRSERKLSGQLRSYFTQHLDPFDAPEPKDMQALQALHAAQTAFGERLMGCFTDALKELEDLGYPGVTDPKLSITTKIRPIDGLNHAAAVQYQVPTTASGATTAHCLPEDSNGLGYQNLVSIVFSLMSFRDKWMKVGKAGSATFGEDALIPPLHLVLIEEPEAHLHAQVQQVFIKQAYDVLRNHGKLRKSKDLRTQLVVSTHSSHLAHEAEFASLRYFRRLPAPAIPGAVPVSAVVNLSEIFGTEDQAGRFVKRYLKATDCDLFFADGAVVVEGSAERILIPHFVRTRQKYEYLKCCYITWLELRGSHAHLLRSLLAHLGLNTLIVTDIDAMDGSTGRVAIPKRDACLKARNETLKKWIPVEDSFDILLDKNAEELVAEDPSGYAIRVAYQQPIAVAYKCAEKVEALANTFEDAIVYENISMFEKLDGTGLIAKFRKALADSTDVGALAQACADALEKGNKAEFALDLLYSDEIDSLKIPAYIDNGLSWLAKQLMRKEHDTVGTPFEVTT